MADDPLFHPDSDPFRPPAVPTEVFCLHCGREYESYLIEWREETIEGGRRMGFWCCPMDGCNGRGFGLDIFPTDPEYIGEDGEPMWCFDEDECEDGAGENAEEDGVWTPPDWGDDARRSPPPGGHGAARDSHWDDDDDLPW